MFLLAIDLSTSAVNVNVVDTATKRLVASVCYKNMEPSVNAAIPGLTEQSANDWWQYVQQAVLLIHKSCSYDPKRITGIALSCRVYGLVLIDKQQQVLRISMVSADYHLAGLAKPLAWLKEQENNSYRQIDKVLLPADFIAMKMTGEVSTSAEAIAESLFFGFFSNRLPDKNLAHFGFENYMFPEIREGSAPYGNLTGTVAEKLELQPGIPVRYKSFESIKEVYK